MSNVDDVPLSLIPSDVKDASLNQLSRSSSLSSNPPKNEENNKPGQINVLDDEDEDDIPFGSTLPLLPSVSASAKISKSNPKKSTKPQQKLLSQEGTKSNNVDDFDIVDCLNQDAAVVVTNDENNNNNVNATSIKEKKKKSEDVGGEKKKRAPAKPKKPEMMMNVNVTEINNNNNNQLDVNGDESNKNVDVNDDRDCDNDDAPLTLRPLPPQSSNNKIKEKSSATKKTSVSNKKSVTTSAAVETDSKINVNNDNIDEEVGDENNKDENSNNNTNNNSATIATKSSLPTSIINNNNNNNNNNNANAKASAETTVQNLIFDYLTKQKRPVNTQSMTDALGSKISKNNVQKGLDALVEEKKIYRKDFKKISIYYPIVAALNVAALQQQQQQEAEKEDQVVLSEEEIAAAEKLKQDILEVNCENQEIEKLIRSERQVLQSKNQNVPILQLEKVHRQLVDEVGKIKTKLHEIDRQEKEQEEADEQKFNNLQKNNNHHLGSSNAQQQIVDPRAALREKISHFRVLPLAVNVVPNNRPARPHHALDDLQNVREKVLECQRLRSLYFDRKHLALDIVDFLSGERRPRDAFTEFGLTSEEEMKRSMTDEDWEAAHIKF